MDNKVNKYLNEGVDPLVGAFRDADIGATFDSIVKQTKKYDPKLAKEMDKFFNTYAKQMERYELDAQWARKKVTNP